MENGIKYLETKTAKYPMVFNINIIEILQEKYGSIEKWADLIEGVVRNEKGIIIERVTPKMRDIKFFIKEAINEGIDIENEQNNETREFVTEKKVGRILTEIDQKNIRQTIKDLTTSSIKTDKQIEEEKNV